jgi:hypothetical protein
VIGKGVESKRYSMSKTCSEGQGSHLGLSEHKSVEAWVVLFGEPARLLREYRPGVRGCVDVDVVPGLGCSVCCVNPRRCGWDRGRSLRGGRRCFVTA